LACRAEFELYDFWKPNKGAKMKTNFQLSLSTAIASVVMLICSTAHSQRMFTADRYGTIYNETNPGSPFVSIFATLPTQPTAMAFDPSGNLFVTQYYGVNTGASGNIVEITPGGTQSTFATGFTTPGGLAFDRTGNLFATDATSGNIYEYTPSGVQSTFASGLVSPHALAFDNAGNLFASTANGITELTPTGAQSSFASGFSGAGGMAFDSSGNLFVSAHVSGPNPLVINKITPSGVITTFASGNYLGMAFDNSGTLFTVNTQSIDEFTPAGVKSTFSSGAFLECIAFQGVTLPVPEPSSLALSLGALFVFVAWHTLQCKSRRLLFNHRDSVYT
jgi:sugar lactone lactonase YvrE